MDENSYCSRALNQRRGPSPPLQARSSDQGQAFVHTGVPKPLAGCSPPRQRFVPDEATPEGSPPTSTDLYHVHTLTYQSCRLVAAVTAVLVGWAGSAPRVWGGKPPSPKCGLGIGMMRSADAQGKIGTTYATPQNAIALAHTQPLAFSADKEAPAQLDARNAVRSHLFPRSCRTVGAEPYYSICRHAARLLCTSTEVLDILFSLQDAAEI